LGWIRNEIQADLYQQEHWKVIREPFLCPISSFPAEILHQAVEYGSGSVSGKEFTDQVALSSSLVISTQGLGVASSSSGYERISFCIFGPLINLL
jgi:hypothetical protein